MVRVARLDCLVCPGQSDWEKREKDSRSWFKTLNRNPTSSRVSCCGSAPKSISEAVGVPAPRASWSRDSQSKRVQFPGLLAWHVLSCGRLPKTIA